MKTTWLIKCHKCKDEISKGTCKCGNLVLKPKSKQVLVLFCDDLSTCHLIKEIRNQGKIFKKKTWFPFNFGKIELIKTKGIINES